MGLLLMTPCFEKLNKSKSGKESIDPDGVFYYFYHTSSCVTNFSLEDIISD